MNFFFWRRHLIEKSIFGDGTILAPVFSDNADTVEASLLVSYSILQLLYTVQQCSLVGLSLSSFISNFYFHSAFGMPVHRKKSKVEAGKGKITWTTLITLTLTDFKGTITQKRYIWDPGRIFKAKMVENLVTQKFMYEYYPCIIISSIWRYIQVKCSSVLYKKKINKHP